MLDPTTTVSLSVPRVPYYQPPTLFEELKLLATELVLRTYHIALTIFASILSCFNISNKSLNDHIFKIHVFIKYTGLESSNFLQEQFSSFLKVPMLNMPKLKHVLEEKDLYWAKHYLQAFTDDCSNNLPSLVEQHI